MVTCLSPHFAGGNTMVDFETIGFKNIPFGKNNFIEIARKRAVLGNGGQTEFISVSRGYFTNDDNKRYKNSVTLPLDEEVRKEIAKNILDI
jgi:hypothetical protein